MRIPLPRHALNMFWKTGPAPGGAAQRQKGGEITPVYGEKAER